MPQNLNVIHRPILRGFFHSSWEGVSGGSDRGLGIFFFDFLKENWSFFKKKIHREFITGNLLFPKSFISPPFPLCRGLVIHVMSQNRTRIPIGNREFQFICMISLSKIPPNISNFSCRRYRSPIAPPVRGHRSAPVGPNNAVHFGRVVATVAETAI